MDPTDVYLGMYFAMRDGDHAEARKLALQLKEWFDNGGYPPPRYCETPVKSYMFSVLWRTGYLTFPAN